MTVLHSHTTKTMSLAPAGNSDSALDLSCCGGRTGGVTLLSWSEAFPETLEPLRPADVFAPLRPAGATSFGAAERVSTPELNDRSPVVAAFDPAGHRPTLVWLAGPGPETTRLQLSTRVG